MKKAAISIASVASLCGACIAFYIGAGFATMQEVMQYEASYGSLFWVVIAVAAVIYLYTNISFATNGSRLKLKRGGDIYKHYCGKYVGTFYDYFSAFFCYVCFIVMCGGANSTVTQQWGLPNGVGAVILTVVVVGTALFGLKGIVGALSKVGPIIIALVLLVSVWTCVTQGSGFAEGAAALDAGKYEVNQVGGGNPLAAGASYAGFVILWFATFLAELGAKNRSVEINLGVVLSAVCVFAVAALSCVALISSIDQTAAADIPALVLAGNISPALAQVFAVVVFFGIYTTSVPLLWTGIGRVAEEGTPRYRMFIVIGGVVGCIIACFLPYTALVNVLYGMNGYLGFILVAFMLVHDVRLRIRGRRAKEPLAQGSRTAEVQEA
ncbi:MAG: hypothetical protein ACI4B9_00785 [Eggerthellaceae bacterium]